MNILLECWGPDQSLTATKGLRNRLSFAWLELWCKECVISSSVVAKPTSETTGGCCNTPFLSSPIADRLLCRPRYLCQSFSRLPASVLSLCLLIAWPGNAVKKATLRVGAAASATSLTEAWNTPGQQTGSNALLLQSYSFGRLQGVLYLVAAI